MVFSVNNSNGRFTLRLTLTEGAYSIANNSSPVTYKLELVANTSWHFSNYSIDSVVLLDGTSVHSKVAQYSIASYGTLLLASGTTTITHDTNGAKIISVAYSIGMASTDYTAGGLIGTGSMPLTTIPRYATSVQSLNGRTETTIRMNWSSDNTIDYIWYSTDNGSNWSGIDVADGTSGYYDIGGLSANTSYNIKTRVRRKDSQLTTDSSTLSVTTYDYPHCTNAPNFTIGESVHLTLYNPLGRTVTVYAVGDNGQADDGVATSGTSMGPYSNALYQSFWYSTIPNSQSGTYKVRVVYGSITREVTGGIYTINESECMPVPSRMSYADINSTVKAITLNDQHIVQGKSTLSVTVNSATPSWHSTIAKYVIEVNGVSKEVNGTISVSHQNFGVVNSSSNVKVIQTVYDSRGMSAKIEMDVTVLPYAEPTAIVDLARKNNYEDETYLTVDGIVASVDNKNTVAIKYRYKMSGGSYGDFVTIGDREKQTIPALDKEKSFIFNVVVTDAFGSKYDKEYVLDKGKFPLFIDTQKNSVGVNCFPTKDSAFEVEGSLVINGIDVTQNRPLFDGGETGWWMQEDHVINLGDSLTKQLSGIVLIFSYFDVENHVAANLDFSCHFVPRFMWENYAGSCMTFALQTGNFGYMGTKTLTFYGDKIVGNALNTQTGTIGQNGVKYDNNRFVLRYIFGV